MIMYHKEHISIQQEAAEKLKAELDILTLDEVSYILGRYSGPRNIFLRCKKFGSVINSKYFEDTVRRVLDEKATDQFIDGMFEE